MAASRPSLSQIAKPAAPPTLPAPPKIVRLSRGIIGELEKTFDGSLMAMADANEPVEILADTRGLTAMLSTMEPQP